MPKKPAQAHTPDVHDAAAALAAVEHTDDAVEYVLRCVLALAPSLSEAVAQAADRHTRELFGGERVYISRRNGEGRSARNDAIRRDYQAGERIPLLMRRYGLSRTSVHMILRANTDV